MALRKQKSRSLDEKFFRIEVRPKKGFVVFRKDSVGKKDGLMRVSGKREDGKWVTVRWLVNKKDAHVDGDRNLIVDDPRVRALLKNIRGQIVHVKGDVYVAKPRRIDKKVDGTDDL